MNSKNYIGVDIGGTKMHFAYINNNKVVKRVKLSTEAFKSKDEIVADIINGIEQLIDSDVLGIGVGVPGLIDVNEGVVYNVQNIPAWKNVALKSLLSSYFHLPVFIGNDANCFLLGENYFGKGTAYSNFIALSLGTGVGAGVLINGKLHLGNLSMAGEFGGINYRDSDFEHYCGGKFFSKNYMVDAKKMAENARNGDAISIKAFQCFGEHVAHLLETIIYAYGPEAIILGGSLSDTFELFESKMMEVLALFPHQNALQTTKIIVSGNKDIPVLGAAALVRYNLVNVLSKVTTNELN